MNRNVIGALMTLIVASSIAVPVVNAQQTIHTRIIKGTYSHKHAILSLRRTACFHESCDCIRVPINGCFG